MAEGEPSYIDYEAFLDPNFSAPSFANTLVTSTNNANDTQLDLATPLSRVLFDLQEIDTHIHNLTTKAALPLLAHTQERTDASQRILKEVEGQVSSLTDGYRRLEREVLCKWENAEEARMAAANSWATLRLARVVGRAITLARQLEGHLAEVTGRGSGKEDHRAMVRAANTLLMLRQMYAATGDGEEGQGLDRVKVTRTLRSDLVMPVENTVKSRAGQVINRFSVSSLATDPVGGTANGAQSPPPPASSTFAQTEETKSRLSSAITTLYLLSPTPQKTGTTTTAADFHPELLLSALQGYIHNSLTSSLSSLARALAMLPSLDRVLTEVSGRCQDLAALEAFLAGFKRPVHPFLPQESAGKAQARGTESEYLLQPLLQVLDTSSLPSYFWRSLASSLPSRVHEILSRGGVSARTLRSNRERIRTELRECVLRGSQLPSTSISKGRAGAGPVMVGHWEREAAVMVSSVVGALGR
jgi:hypothetical protein